MTRIRSNMGNILLDLLGNLITSLFQDWLSERATGTRHPQLPVYVGSIAGVFAILIYGLILLITSPGSTLYTFFNLLALALVVGGIVGTFGGLIGARLTKDAPLAVQTASIVFFGALGALLPACMCARFLD